MATREALRVALNPDPRQTRWRKRQSSNVTCSGQCRSPTSMRTVPVGRITDRLRADLADLVPFGAGFYLIDYNEVVAGWMALNISR